MAAIPASILTNEIITSYDLLPPEKWAELVARYGDQGFGAFDLFRTMGFTKGVKNGEYSNFEENRYHETLVVLANVAAPGTGNNISFTLDPASLDASNRFYARLWDKIVFPGGVTGSISNINTATPSAPIITVIPDKSTFAIPALTAGQKLVIYSSAFAEGTDQPDSAIAGTTEIFNHTQIIKETYGYTGTAATDDAWFRVKGPKGGQGYYRAGFFQSEYRFSLKIDGALMVGNTVNNPNLVDPNGLGDGVPYGTEGLLPAIVNRGNPYAYTPGAWSVYDFDAMDRILDREGASSKVLGLLALDFLQENNNAMANFFTNTNIQMATQSAGSVMNGNAELAAVINFTYLQKNDRLFMFKKWAAATNPVYLGADGYNYRKMGIFLPLNPGMKDAKSGEKMGNIGMRFKELNGYSRMSEIWQLGSLGNQGQIRTTSTDTQNMYMRGEIGAHQMAMNQAILVTP